MQKGRLVYSEGVVDVSIIVPACFNNPLKDDSISFISQVLTGKKKATIPISSIIGAYHITTQYLKVPRNVVREILDGILRIFSPALCSSISPDVASKGLEYSVIYDIEAWDGYLIALAKSLGTSIIYSLDKELSKIREVTVVNPFTQDNVRKYHDFIKARFKTK
ncbi:MAG: PIN domain-containing protein [Nitrososphaeria archaeon]|nr:PIN domain-containing protein [Nitrososphaeria archaeon]